MKVIRLVVVLSGMLLLTSCAGVVRIDPSAFRQDPTEKVKIPPVCKSSYDNAIPSVAVCNISNNSSFDYAKVVNKSVSGSSERTNVGGAAAGVTPGGVGVVWGEKEKRKFQSESQKVTRDVNAKLPESVEDGIVDELVNMGGCKIYTRSEMKKLMEEHKFQQSGLVEDSTIVQLGKMVGIRYMITGSINNVNMTYSTNAESRNLLREKGGILGSIAAAGLETREGWHVEAELTFRVLDVETGEILLSKKVIGKEILGKIPYPSFDAMIGGIKKASAKAMEDARPDLSRYFTIKGYILQTKSSADGSDRVALISVGSKLGIKPGMKMMAYAFEEIEDPLSGKKGCDQQKLAIELEVTDQVQADKAWVILKGDQAIKKRIKAGQLVERVALEGQGFMKKMGY